jgi:hypothetical protein
MIITHPCPFEKLDIPEEWIDFAKSYASKIPALRNSFRNGEGKVIGILGEMLAARFMGCGEALHSYDNDFMYQNYAIEVKTKECQWEPRPFYNVSVSASNTTQKCDFYVFMRVNKDLSHGWFLGGINRDEYYKKARFFNKDQVDPLDPFFKFPNDCYCLPISELKPFKRKTQ